MPLEGRDVAEFYFAGLPIAAPKDLAVAATVEFIRRVRGATEEEKKEAVAGLHGPS